MQVCSRWGRAKGFSDRWGLAGRGALLVGTDFVSPKAGSPMFQNCVFKRFRGLRTNSPMESWLRAVWKDFLGNVGPKRLAAEKPKCKTSMQTPWWPRDSHWAIWRNLTHRGGSRERHPRVPVPAGHGTGGDFEVPGGWVGRTVWSHVPAVLETSPAHAVPDPGHMRWSTSSGREACQ